MSKPLGSFLPRNTQDARSTGHFSGEEKEEEEKEEEEKEEEQEKNVQIAFRCIEAVAILSLDY